MGQKTSPIGFRTGITLGWESTWFAPKANYGDFLIEDWKVREYVDKKFNRQPPYSAVAKVEVARTRNEVKVTLHTARPGMVIGPRGAEVEALKEELEELIDRKVNVNVIEIKEPSLNATLVAEGIAEQLKKRASYRRAMKTQCENAMNAGAKGVKIICDCDSKESIKLYDNEMMQVILNILKNAQDNFIEKEIENPEITITTNDKSIIVCDNGGCAASRGYLSLHKLS